MDAEAAARWLAEAWQSGNALAPLPEALAPGTTAEGEDVAAALIEALGLPVIGLRVVPGPGARRIAGPLIEGRLMRDGATLAAAMLRHARMTAAVVGVLAEALEADGGAPVFSALHPAVDVSGSRFTTAPGSEALAIADFAGLGHVIAGPGAAVPAGPVDVALGQGRKRSSGANVDVMAALGEAAEQARRLGGLPAGAVLVAAGLTPGVEPTMGVEHVARMGALGRARVRIG